MPTLFDRRGNRWLWALFMGSALTGAAATARAAVTQPDGTVMPLASPGNEVSLQALFDFREGDGVLDAVADASTEPATFKPLCDFTAQLLLRETSSDAAVGWYNSPVADTPPVTVCNEASGLSSGGGPCSASDIFVLVPGNVSDPPYGKAGDPLHHPGTIFTGGDIASNPHYAGGDIGFALLTTQRHYSEARLNPACSGATCTQGDHWLPTIMYASKATARGFYMCSEDQAVGPTQWGNNDGDFNDFVFLFTGLVCSGSGMACDTGQPGICAAGLTDCADAAGESDCRPARSPGDEACNGLDDDCNGETDEGELCPAGELCVKARCVPVCSTGEFRCAAGSKCVDGACVEDACVDVECAAGKVCVGGACVGACDDVSCPYQQECRDGVCVDPCDGIDCGEGFVCDGGACLVECGCAGCATGECDAEGGHCVDSGCADVRCDVGLHCEAGVCVDDCAGVRCPGGAVCSAGICASADVASQGGQAGADGSSDPGIDLDGDPSPDPTAQGGSGQAGSGISAGGHAPHASTPGVGARDPGCACRAAGGYSGAAGYWLALAGGAWLMARRRAARRFDSARG